MTFFLDVHDVSKIFHVVFPGFPSFSQISSVTSPGCIVAAQQDGAAGGRHGAGAGESQEGAAGAEAATWRSFDGFVHGL